MLINKLDQIDKIHEFHYIYDDLDFLYKPTPNAKQLIVILHGARSNHPVPIFRGYDWKIDSSSILCLADPVLKLYYPNLALSWYLDTKKCKKFDKQVEIVKHISTMSKYEKIIFHASSGGCFACLKLACIFNQYAVILNPQLYLEKYYYYKILTKLLKDNNDQIDDIINADQLINKYGNPKKIIIFCNEKDTHHFLQHANIFVNNNKNKINIEYNHFTEKKKKMYQEKIYIQ